MFGKSRLHYALLHDYMNRKQNASSKLWIQNVLDSVKRSLECLSHMCSKCKSEMIQIHQLLVTVYFNLSNSVIYDRGNLSRTLKKTVLNFKECYHTIRATTQSKYSNWIFYWTQSKTILHSSLLAQINHKAKNSTRLWCTLFAVSDATALKPVPVLCFVT